jgi:hypothetical protein
MCLSKHLRRSYFSLLRLPLKGSRGLAFEKYVEAPQIDFAIERLIFAIATSSRL